MRVQRAALYHVWACGDSIWSSNRISIVNMFILATTVKGSESSEPKRIFQNTRWERRNVYVPRYDCDCDCDCVEPKRKEEEVKESSEMKSFAQQFGQEAALLLRLLFS
jgi:hypothetical protein